MAARARHNASIPLRCSEVDLVRLIESTLEPLARDAERMDVSLRFEHPGVERCAAVVDAEKIAWAVATLAGNSLRYVRRGSRLHPGGSVVVRLATSAKTPGDVVLEVRDDGRGIPPERVRVLFTRAPGAPHALGLSLALVKDVVEAHGGALEVDSTTNDVEHGTIVRLAFPIA